MEGDLLRTQSWNGELGEKMQKIFPLRGAHPASAVKQCKENSVRMAAERGECSKKLGH